MIDGGTPWRSDRSTGRSAGAAQVRRPARNQLGLALTLRTGFGVLDVGHGFGAQGPDGDSQL